jgi:hypothetical protein
VAHPGFWDSIGRDLSGRGLLGGPIQIRLFLQPVLAMLLGIKFGIQDAKAGKAPFFQQLAHTSGGRGAIVKQAARDALIPLCIALLLDSILQHMINGRVRPLAALIVGGILVFIPFLIVRALANRAWTHGHHGQARHAGKPH